MEPLRAAAQAAVEALPGVESVSAILTAHSTEPQPSRTSTPKGPPPELGTRRKPAQPADKRIPGVARVIPIASGKGGVGKSTVASNLAVAHGRAEGSGGSGCSTPTSTVPRSRGCSASPGRPSSPDGDDHPAACATMA